LYAASGLLAVLAGIVGYFVFGGRGDVANSPAGNAQPVLAGHVALHPPARNGALTLMVVEASVIANDYEGPQGWYGISSVDAGGQLHLVVRCPHRVTWCGEIESIDWSPGGKRVAVGVTSFGVDNPYNGLRLVNPGTGSDQLLVKPGGYENERDWYDLDWSPDGRRVAYMTSGRISLVNVEGGARTVLRTGTIGHDHSPSWSPDGAWVAYGSRHEADSTVYLIHPDGSDRRLLVRHASYPAWSPDGSKIAVLTSRGVVLVSPTGALLAPRASLATGAAIGITGPPVWSPDGRKIAMSNRRYGTYVMNADGSALQRLTTQSIDVSLGQANRPAWQPLR
jgi:dipeptidyl aminopeptidase/acylaminoacyl peptidase